MLTREEQDQIFDRAKQFAEDYAKVMYRRRRYQLDPSEADEIGRAHREIFGQAQPASTMVAVAALLDPQWKVEIEVEAVVMERPS